MNTAKPVETVAATEPDSEVRCFRSMLDQARWGNVEVIGRLFMAIQGSLTLAVSLKLHKGYGVGAEDVVQETFITAWKELPNCRAETFPEFRGWMYTMAMNKMKNIGRSKQAKIVDRPKPLSEHFDREQADTSTDVKLVDSHELAQVTVDEYWQLGDEQRMAIEEHVLNGRTYIEAAKILDTKSGTVSSRCSRGINKINQRLKDRFGTSLPVIFGRLPLEEGTS